MAAGLGPDQLGELERSPRPQAALRGGLGTFQEGEMREGKEREGMRGGGEGENWNPLTHVWLRGC